MLYATVYWCCPHSIRSRVYAVVSRLSESICVSHRSTAATAVGGFAAKRPVDRRYWWIPAGDLLQALALSSNCGQRLVESRRRRLNTDLLVMVSLQCCVAAMNGKARSRKTPNSFSLVFHSSLHFTLLSVPFWCLFLFIMHLAELFFFFSLWSEVQTCIWPSWCQCYSLSLASVKFRLVLPFWYQLVPDKGF